jgi:hypothetical protein
MRNMKNIFLVFLILLLFGCSKSQENQTIGLTQEEAEFRMREFLNENTQKYKNYGELETINLIGGNYTKDGVHDYFYNIRFWGGGDYVSTSYFFYDSEQDKIRELTKGMEIDDYMVNININEIIEGKLIGSFDLWKILGGEDNVDLRTFNSEFTIEENLIIVEKKHQSLFKDAKKEISNGLKKVDPEENCKSVAVDYLIGLGVKILYLNDEGYRGGVCQGGPGQYCGRVEKFYNGKYWAYDIVVFTEKDNLGNCTVKGSNDNLN